MRGKTKALQLALLAALVMSAVAAQGAQVGVVHKYVLTGASTADVTGTNIGNHILSFGQTNLECATATLTGMLESAEGEEWKAMPAIKNCHIGEVEVTVTNGEEGVEGTTCWYTFHGETTTDPTTAGVESATVTVSCPEGQVITLKGPGCTVKFGTQGPLHGIHYTNKRGTEPTDIDITAKVHGVAYTATGLFCGAVGVETVTHSNGVYEGTATVRAYKTGSEHIAANQLGLHVIPLEQE